MAIFTGILYALIGLLLIIVIKLSTTFFHEMGHAIPALLFTQKNVQVYVGSYGNISKTTNFELGRLKIYFKWNLLDWKMGMCRHEEVPKKTWQNVLIILGGPIASLIIALPILLNLRAIEPYPVPFLIAIVFIAAAFYDFVVNMIPTSSPIKMHDGSIAFCDGYALYNIAIRSSAPPEYFKLEEKFQAKKYDEVLTMGKEILEEKPKYRFVYEFMIESLKEKKDIDGALEMFLLLKHNLNLTDIDYFNIGKLYRLNGNYTEALKFFDHYRHKHFSDVELLNEIALAHLELGNNEKAIETLDASLHVDQKYLQTYITRSHALINLREYDYAKADLELVFKITDKNPDANFLFGLLHEKLNNNKQALHYYEQAQLLKCEMHGLDFRIASVREI